MRYSFPGCCLLLSLAVTAGCTSISDSTRTAASSVKNAASPVLLSWKRASSSKKEIAVKQWDWTLGLPVNAPRGELVAAKVPRDAVARLLPQVKQNDIRLVSTAPQISGFEIRNISGHEIENCSDLYQALEQVPDTAVNVQVDLAPIGAPRGTLDSAVRVDRATLMSLAHAVAPELTEFRVSDGGNATFVIRESDIRGQMVVRVERNYGLVQLVMTLENCGENDVLLPAEVGVQCDAQPLPCLTVADTLELLYGEPESDFGTQNPSFVQTSQREDYLLPVNYKTLAGESPEPGGLTLQTPAFASLTGMRYPGSALLGDARALTGIMLQQEVLKRGQRSKTGWVLFAGENVRTAEHLDISLDLGSGPRTYRFMIPSAR